MNLSKKLEKRFEMLSKTGDNVVFFLLPTINPISPKGFDQVISWKSVFVESYIKINREIGYAKAIS